MGAQIFDEAEGVGIRTGQLAVRDDDGIDRADTPRRIIDRIDQRQRRFLMGNREINAAKTLLC